MAQFGWGLEINNEQLEEINRFRYGRDYVDKAAAIEVNGNTKKMPLRL